jgi:hypothetical protein
MLAALHQALVYHLCGIVTARFDVHTLLYHRIRSGPQNLAGLVAARLDDGAMLRGRHRKGGVRRRQRQDLYGNDSKDGRDMRPWRDGGWFPEVGWRAGNGATEGSGVGP